MADAVETDESMGEMDMFDIEDSEAKARAIADGVKAAEEGRVHPHEIVGQWLARLADDPRLPFHPEDYA